MAYAASAAAIKISSVGNWQQHRHDSGIEISENISSSI